METGDTSRLLAGCREKASFKALSWWWRSAARLVEVGGRRLEASKEKQGQLGSWQKGGRRCLLGFFNA